MVARPSEQTSITAMRSNTRRAPSLVRVERLDNEPLVRMTGADFRPKHGPRLMTLETGHNFLAPRQTFKAQLLEPADFLDKAQQRRRIRNPRAQRSQDDETVEAPGIDP